MYDIDVDADTTERFARVVEHARTQSDEPGSDAERVTVRRFDTLDADALRGLSAALERSRPREGAGPDATAIYLSPANAQRVLERDGLEEFEPLEGRLGRPIRVEAGMPDDAILVMAPDAVDRESGELLDPTAVACGTLGTG